MSWVMFTHQAHRLLLHPVLLPRKVGCVVCRNVSPGSGGPGRQHRRPGRGRRTVWGTQDPAEESELLQAGGRLQAGPAQPVLQEPICGKTGDRLCTNSGDHRCHFTDLGKLLWKQLNTLRDKQLMDKQLTHPLPVQTEV